MNEDENPPQNIFSWDTTSLARSLHSTKDVSHHPFFLGMLSPLAWRLYTHRTTPAGRWFLVVTLAFMLYGSASLDLQVFVPFTYAFGVWTIAVLAAAFQRLPVSLAVSHSEKVGAGETLPVDLEVTYEGRVPSPDLVFLPYRLPQPIWAVPEDGVPCRSLNPGEKVTLRLGLSCTRRGVFTLRGYRVQTDFPFGLLRAYRFLREDRKVTVTPRFTPLRRFDIPTGRSYQPGGVVLASTLGDSFEFIANREYREGDNIRDIDWRATARLDRPIVREFRQEYFHRIGVILDTHVTDLAFTGENAAFERAVSMCAAVSEYMSRQEYLIDLFAAGPNLYHFTAGRSLASQDQILEILACLEPSRTEPFSVLEPELLEHLARITTIVCIFLDWTESRRDFVAKLRLGGAGIRVLIVRDTEPTLDPTADLDPVNEMIRIKKQDFEGGIEEL